MKTRAKILAVLVVILLLAGVLALLGKRPQSPAPVPSLADAERRVSVVLASATQMRFEERLSVAGDVQPKTFALVSARVPGTLDAVFVDEGDEVTAGQTRLFQTDSVKLTKAVAIAQDGLAVAVASVKEKQAEQERVEADLNKARLDYERFKRLYENDQAVTKSAFEAQESRYLQVQAELRLAAAKVELAEQERKQAESRLAVAEKDLRDSLVLSPLTGRVTRKLREPGEMAGAGTPVLRVEDLSTLEFSAFLPGEYFSRVTPGVTVMRVHVGDLDLGEIPVSEKSPTVDSLLRTFEVKCVATNPPPGVVPGRMAQVDVILQKRDGVGVPVDALVQRADGRVLFTVEAGSARAVPVQTGLRTDGWMEVLGAAMEDGTAVVVMGQELLRDGLAVAILEGAR